MIIGYKLKIDHKVDTRLDLESLDTLENYARKGDTVVVDNLNALADKGVLLDHAKNMINNGVTIKAINYGYIDDIKTLQSFIDFSVYATDLRNERMGAPLKYGTDEDILNTVFERYYDKMMLPDEAMDELGMPKGTFYRRYRQWKKQKGLT